jgi:hypothetical protein
MKNKQHQLKHSKMKKKKPQLFQSLLQMIQKHLKLGQKKAHPTAVEPKETISPSQTEPLKCVSFDVTGGIYTVTAPVIARSDWESDIATSAVSDSKK